jgi:hypothetical protein
MPTEYAATEDLDAWSTMFNPRFTWSPTPQEPSIYDPLPLQPSSSPCRSQSELSDRSEYRCSSGGITKHRHSSSLKTKHRSPRSSYPSLHTQLDAYAALTRQDSQDSDASYKGGDTRPRCYDHGCGGKVFSCAENYRRHMRERDRSSTTQCPHCSISFSRKSNRDTHIAKGRCRGLGDAARKCS